MLMHIHSLAFILRVSHFYNSSFVICLFQAAVQISNEAASRQASRDLLVQFNL